MTKEDKEIFNGDKFFLINGLVIGFVIALVIIAITIAAIKDKKLSNYNNHTKNVFIVNNTCKNNKLKLLIKDKETQEVTWHSTNIKCKVF